MTEKKQKQEEILATEDFSSDAAKASIVMRGVSGKKITADVKVVKIKKKKKQDTDGVEKQQEEKKGSSSQTSNTVLAPENAHPELVQPQESGDKSLESVEKTETISTPSPKASPVTSSQQDTEKKQSLAQKVSNFQDENIPVDGMRDKNKNFSKSGKSLASSKQEEHLKHDKQENQIKNENIASKGSSILEKKEKTTEQERASVASPQIMKESNKEESSTVNSVAAKSGNKTHEEKPLQEMQAVQTNRSSSVNPSSQTGTEEKRSITETENSTSTTTISPSPTGHQPLASVINPQESALAATVARFAAQAMAKKNAEERKKRAGSRGEVGDYKGTRGEGRGEHTNYRGNASGNRPYRRFEGEEGDKNQQREGTRFSHRGSSSEGNRYSKENRGESRPFRSGTGFSGTMKDKDEEKSTNFTRKSSPRRTTSDLDTELINKQKENRINAFASSDKYKKQAGKDKEGVNRNTLIGKDVSRTIKKKASEYTRGASGEDDVMEAVYRATKGKSKRGKLQKVEHGPIIQEVLTNISLPSTITVKEFAEAIKKTSGEVIKTLMKLGVMATLNQELDYDTAAILAGEFGIVADRLVEVTEEDILFDDSEDVEENLMDRPPVVVVMGHVDHGKTSLLDRIRQSSVVDREAGGITQHIGAYMAECHGRKITFLDTPGHEAFTTMRARGAQTTDIAVLVVAADDGVMPQTIESINHAKAANTQIVVAINKIDRPGANIDKVKQELAQHEVVSEEWGGSTVMVPVSAKTGEGIPELLEMILLTADVMELKADPKRQAKGTIIEAKLDKQKGPVATLLIQRGTLHAGDTVVTGQLVGRIRAMLDYTGKPLQEAGPSTPVEILGLPEVPEAGEIFYAVQDEKVARQLAEKRRIKNREENIGRSSKMSLENLFSQMAQGEVKNLPIIVKADVVGSVEAVRSSLERLSNDEVHVKVIHGGVGAINESDVRLAEVSNAIIIGFNVRPGVNVAEIAKEAEVSIRLYRVIYHAIDEIEAAMKGMLDPTYKEVELGKAEIRQVFKASNIGTIGGSYVLSGKILRNCDIRLVREGIVIREGKLASLKRFKDDVREVAAGYECGIAIEDFNDLKVGDIIECFQMEEIKRD